MRGDFFPNGIAADSGFAGTDRLADFFDGRIVSMILAGGKGERLRPLTEGRAKAAVPFGGMCRLIDFVLSNMVNSGVHEIYVLTQYKAHSLIRHLQQGWAITHPLNGYSLMPVPPQMDGRDSWYLGTADAVYQNFGLIRKRNPELVLIFGSDHVYSMDIRPMIRWHLEKRAEVTVATIPMPLTQCSQFGTARVGPDWRIVEFEEKTQHPRTIPGRPDQALVSMGNYIFETRALIEELTQDASDPLSRHDFGRDILPKICKRRRVFAYDFRGNTIPGNGKPTDYWRDVGTIKSYYQANMDLNNPLSHLNLYNPEWPLRSVPYHDLPAKVMADVSGKSGYVENSILGSSTVVSGGYVRDSVIGPHVRISSGAVVEESVVLGQVIINERARIRKAIVDHGNVIGEAARIGYDREQDVSRYHIDEAGIIVVPHAGLSDHLRGGDDERQMSFLLGQERAADQSGPRSRSGRGDRTLDAMLRL